jgi:hypothetical protein
MHFTFDINGWCEDEFLKKFIPETLVFQDIEIGALLASENLILLKNFFML